MLDVPVAEIVLQRPSIHALIGQLKPGRMPQHVGMGRKRHLGGRPKPRHHPSNHAGRPSRPSRPRGTVLFTEPWRALLISLTIFPSLIAHCSYNRHCEHSFPTHSPTGLCVICASTCRDSKGRAIHKQLPRALDRVDVVHAAAVPLRAEPAATRCGEMVE